MDDFAQLDYYELLDIRRSASADEIKQAYRQQMRRYHPDRVAGASPEEQAYASRRALQINAAYQALSDFSARAAYNRSLGGGASSPPSPHPMPQKPRDHQAELYDRAREHLDAGRALQAVATLRELQQLNPFYRDSAALLAQAESMTPRKPPPPPAPPVPDRSRRALLLGGVGGVLLAAVGGVAWWLRRDTAAASPSAAPTAASASDPTSAAVIAAAAPTATPAPPTAAPTSPPPTAAPTSPPPTAIPTAAPTATPEPLAEDGRLVYAEEFRGDAWPTTSGSGWSVASGGGAYTITTAPGLGNIWAYRTSPAGEDILLGVDVAVSGGEAGLVLRFSDAGSYLAFLVSPAERSFRLEQRVAGRVASVISERNLAVLSGVDASNRLVARLEGDQIELRVNGRQVADLTLAAPPPTSQYGMLAVAGAGPVEATFTKLSLRAIAP
ncbi:J domain-containing protein [Oscillochloris sp. ZM17-4]|uniref:J domain-containing protein n=1 Tax=Oscillochloris sp. ZM17-4 TaxID=2866714 RepID=UPI001C72EEC8|nr:J domain-containing protein [Oscillochloris sp. ZM17-4]MBX0328129.1 J domain-containing protein [Oscillochloris sp. ZM17-4]